jgi:hypothetical protein
MEEVERERATPDRREALGQDAGDVFVRVDIHEELERPGAFLGSNELGGEQMPPDSPICGGLRLRHHLSPRRQPSIATPS